MSGHDKPESPVTINRNGWSRSTGIPNSSTWRLKDSQTGLIWTNGNAFSDQGLTFAQASDAAASLGVGWRLPTYEGFHTLRQNLGQTAQPANSNVWGGVFTTNGVQYWTSTPKPSNSAEYLYFVPKTPVESATLAPSHYPNLPVTTWAVTTVPEPDMWALLLAGMGLGFCCQAAQRQIGLKLPPSKP